jgi:hypothetical protein
VQPHRSRARDKKLADNSHLLRAWHRRYREQLDEALAGPHGALVGWLLDQLRELTLRDGAKLVAFIRAQDWSRVDANTKFVCLHEFNNGTTKLRVQAGMPPFDDGLPPERATVFLIIKPMIAELPPD